ncbi:MAG: MFS transporter [Anaerolineae bacterium]
MPKQTQRHVKQTALLAASLSSFLTAFMGSSLNVALPRLSQELGLDAVLLGWVQTVYLLAAAVFLVPFGRLADLHGRKKVYLWGIAAFGAASLLCGVASGPGSFLGFRVLQGLGAAMIFGTGTAIVTSAYPPQERGRALGISIASVYVGLSAGPFLGGFLTEHWGWRSIFFADVAIAVVALGMVLARLQGEWAEARGEPFDWRGSLLYGVAVVAVMYGLPQVPGSVGLGLVALGLLGLAAFVWWERRTPSPVLEVRLFLHSRTFTFSSLAALINYSATAAVAFLMSLYLQYLGGLSPQKAGLVLVIQPVVQALFAPLAGRLSDRVEPQVVASAGMGLTALGLLLLTFLGPATSLAYIYVALAFLGLGFGFFSSPNTNAIMGSVERQYYGVASAIVATMRLLGQMLSMGIATLLLALYVGQVQMAPPVYPFFLRAVHAAFVLFTVACVGGIFASLARGKMRAAQAQGGSQEKAINE